MSNFIIYSVSDIETFISIAKDTNISSGLEFISKVKTLDLNAKPVSTFPLTNIQEDILTDSISKNEVNKIYAEVINSNSKLQEMITKNPYILFNSISIHFLSNNKKIVNEYKDDNSTMAKNLDYNENNSKSRLRWVYDSTHDFQSYYRNVFLIPIKLLTKCLSSPFTPKILSEASTYLTSRNTSKSMLDYLSNFYFSGDVMTNTQHYENLASRYITALNPIIIFYASILYTDSSGNMKSNITKAGSVAALPSFCKFLEQLSANYFIENMSIEELKTILPNIYRIS